MKIDRTNTTPKTPILSDLNPGDTFVMHGYSGIYIVSSSRRSGDFPNDTRIGILNIEDGNFSYRIDSSYVEPIVGTFVLKGIAT